MHPLDNYYKSLDLSNNFAWKYIAVDGNGEVYLYFHEKPYLPSEGAGSWRNASPEVGAVLVERIPPPLGFNWRQSLRSREEITNIKLGYTKINPKNNYRRIINPHDATPYVGMAGGLRIVNSDGEPLAFFLASEVKSMFKRLMKMDELLNKIVDRRFLATKTIERSKQYTDTFFRLLEKKREWRRVIEGLK